MKSPYETPEVDLILIANADIITASSGNDIGEDYGENDGEWM